jgi:hypothetical protein
MRDTETVRPTRIERETLRLKARFEAHVREWYPREVKEFPVLDMYFHVSDYPCELWSCELSRRGAPTPHDDAQQVPADASEEREGKMKPITKWLLWDRLEVISYDEDEFQDAYHDFINKQKERRMQNKLRYWTSPLAISAILALSLCLLIAILEVCKYQVPDQLWSIFTAVIAFYFGRESSRKSIESPTEE